MENQIDKIHDLVREKYSKIATGGNGGYMPSCCNGTIPLDTIKELGKVLDN